MWVKNEAKLLNLCSKILNQTKVNKKFRNSVYRPVLTRPSEYFLRECALTTAGGNNKSVGGSLNSTTPFWGDHQIPDTHYGGITKSNFMGSENWHLIKCTKKNRSYAIPSYHHFPSSWLSILKLHFIWGRMYVYVFLRECTTDGLDLQVIKADGSCLICDTAAT